MPSTGDLIEDNLIGVLADSSASGNGQAGIFAQGTSGLAIFGNTAEDNGEGIEVLNSIGTAIGGTALGAANVISDNLHPGLVLDQDQGLAVIGNMIESNGSSGITGGGFSGSSALFADNIIKSNAGAGIFVGSSSVTIEIQGNDIESNQNGGVSISVGKGAIKSSSLAINAKGSSSSFAAKIVGNTIKTNTGDGIFVAGGVVTLTIQGNDIEGNTTNGIDIENESNATIGGSAAGAGNIVAGNSGQGVLVAGTFDSSPVGDLIEGNKIGVLANSTASGNATGGIDLASTSGVAVLGNTIENNLASGIVASNTIGTTIGGSAAGAANIITANSGFGIDFLDGESEKVEASSSLSTGDLIQDNLIGVLADGTAVGNLSSGIYANDTSGLLILGNTVEASGKYRLDITGEVSDSGIEIDASTGTTIGGSAAGAGNIIGDNAADGVLLEGTPEALSTGDLIEDNLIGVVAVSTASGNGQAGIFAQGTSGLTIFGNSAENNGEGIEVLNSIGTTIGGTASARRT